MKRKKNKKKIIFILLGLLLILIMGIILLIIYKDKDNNELNINDKIVINDSDVFIYNNFYIKKNEDNINGALALLIAATVVIVGVLCLLFATNVISFNIK